MSAEEFWKGDPQLFVSYRTSFINKKKRQLEEEDYKSWLQGFYNHQSNSSIYMALRQFLFNIVASFTKGTKDNTTLADYPKKPLMQEKKEEEKKEPHQEDKNNNYKQFESDLVYFGTLKKQYLEKLSKKGE